eukprot:Seg2216.3 transcript_id=Seg2216.3/GoldUCD/mRNA.D3Y31 product="Protein LTV1-like" protein_id=Seg2216.3/GoldUCD/D3Y31
MGKNKKPFIDKKKSVKFHLVHRDQRDPLQADSDAPERVLLQAEEKKRNDPKETQKEHGIYFDDEYDYLQHLKPRGDGILLLADETGPPPKPSMFKEVGGISLPSEVLPSEYEEDEGMLEKGVLPRGPQPDWDPDIVEALDDGLDLDDPDNILEDDFMLVANAEGGEGECSYGYAGQGYQDSDGSISDRDFGSDDCDFDNESFGDFANEETKSRFTNYSMTSSVIRRTEGLKLLDDQFEKVMEEYDEDQIGGLDEDDMNGVLERENPLVDQVVNELNDQQIATALQVSKSGSNLPAQDSDDDNNEEYERVQFEAGKEQWDCESIISTYSNIYNHPKLITEPKPIKLTKKLAIPADVLRKKEKAAALQQEVKSINERNKHSSRVKDESKEEKKLRKDAVKEERRYRRAEKKLNKQAFKDEQKIQERILATQLKTAIPI